ncbi:MAG: hypothetical protein ABGF52_04110 [Candidatus Asgardarchaeum sp.]
MKYKKLKVLIIVFLLTILMLPMISSAPIVTATSLYETTVTPINPFTEHLRITVGRNISVVVEHVFTGVEFQFSHIDTASDAFDGLTEFIIAGRQGIWRRRHWPHPLWPVPEGLYVGMTFENLEEDVAVSHSEEIIAMVEAELGVAGFSLFGYVKVGARIRIVYYVPYSLLENYTFSNFVDYWSVFLPSDGLVSLVNLDALKSSPVAISLVGMFKQPDGWATIVAAAYLAPDVIQVEDDGTYVLSVNGILNHSGPISASEDSHFSSVRILIPYVGNVTYYSPETDNLFPDMNGEFFYLLKPKGPVENNNADDIIIKYNLAFYAEPTFPLLETRFEIDPPLPIIKPDETIELTFRLNVTNKGESYAYNIVSAIPLARRLIDNPNLFGDKPVNITRLFKFVLIHTLMTTEVDGKTIFMKYFGEQYSNWNGHNVSLVVFHGYVDDIISRFEEQRISMNVSQEIWLNVTISSPNMVLNETFLGSEARNLVAYVGKIAELAPNESVEFNVTITLPGLNQILDPIDNASQNIDYPPTVPVHTPYEPPYDIVHFPVDPELGNITQEAILNATKYFREMVTGNITKELWRVPIGPFTIYKDSIGHNFWTFANGLATQVNDDQPVLVGIANISDLTVLIDQQVEISLSIDNIGNATAEDVEVTFYHAIADYNWTFHDISIIKTVSIGDIEEGEKITTSINVTARTRIGVHPVYANITYTDDDGRTITVFSNMIFAIVLPKFAEKPKPDYPFPTPELEVQKVFDKYSASVGETIAVTINITNVGDEDTRIIIVDTINSTAFEVLPDTLKVYRNGEDITDYVKVGVAFDRTVRDCHITAVIIRSNVAKPNVGIYLEPNETLTITYTMRVKAAGSVVGYPLIIRYTSLHPIYASEMPSGSGEGETGSLSINYDSSSITVNDILKGFQTDEENQVVTYSASFSVALEEAAEIFPVGRIVIIAGIILVIVTVIVVVNQRRKRQIVSHFS